MKIIFLGTGTSHGVPVIGCGCPVCRSKNPKDKRLRPALFIELESGGKLLIDTPPDLRQQCLERRVGRVDAVLFTHHHNDHINGLDDLRRFNEMYDAAIPCLGPRQTLDEIRKKFRYIFIRTQTGGGKPKIALRAVDKPFELLGQRIVPLPVYHGNLKIFGYRLGNFAYITDCSRIPARTVKLLAGVRTLVLNALRRSPHPTHLSLGEALEQIRRIGPEKTYLTHICHDLSHAYMSRVLPPEVEPAYDGLVLKSR